MAGRLAGKVALVSGGARGLGAAHVELFAEEGAAVVFGDLLDHRGREVERTLQKRGLSVTYVHLDVTSVDDWRSAIDETLSSHGRLTTLVNNAAVYSWRGLEEAPDDEWESIIGVNLEGTWHGMRAAMPALRAAGAESGASVVNICSIYGVVGSVGSSSYHASKGGVRLLTKATAVEYAPQGVRVNAVNPGMMDTEFAGPGLTPEIREEQIAGIPLGRSAAPREVAYSSLFLASDEAAYITGAELTVDGGWTVP